MAPYKLIPVLSIFSVALAVTPIFSDPTTDIVILSPSTSALSTAETLPDIHQTRHLDRLPAFLYAPGKPFRDSKATRDPESEDADPASITIIIPPSDTDLSSPSAVEIPTEFEAAEFRRETKHTNKGFWSDLLRTITRSRPSSSASSIIDKHDSLAPSLPQLDLGPTFDGKDITDAIFSGFTKRDEVPGIDSLPAVETPIAPPSQQPGGNPKNKGLWSSFTLGYHLFGSPPSSVSPSRSNSRSRPKLASVTPSLPQLDLGPAFDANEITANYEQYANPWTFEKTKRDPEDKDADLETTTGIVPQSAHPHLHPMIGLSLATIVKLHRDVRLTNPFSKSSPQSATALVGTPFSASASAYNRPMSHKEPAQLQNEVPKGWRLERVILPFGVPGVVFLCLLWLLAICMALFYMSFHAARERRERQREVLPRFNEKEM